MTTGLGVGAAFVIGVLLTLLIVRRSAGYRVEYRRLLITSSGKETNMSTTEPRPPDEEPDEHGRPGKPVDPVERPDTEDERARREREERQRDDDDQAPA